MPEPDLPPLVLSEEYLARLRAGMPELPDAIEERMVSVYGISGCVWCGRARLVRASAVDGATRRPRARRDDCATLVSEPGAIGYFEALARGRDARAAAGFIVNVLFAQLKWERAAARAAVPPLPPAAAVSSRVVAQPRGVDYADVPRHRGTPGRCARPCGRGHDLSEGR